MGFAILVAYEAIVFFVYSHNRRFGEAFVRGKTYYELAEDYATAHAIMSHGEICGVKLPIHRGVYGILYEGKDAYAMLNVLFTRKIKNEF